MSIPREFLDDGLSVLIARYDPTKKYEGADLQTALDMRQRIGAPSPSEEDIAICQKLLAKHEITQYVVHAVCCRGHFDGYAHQEVKAYCEKQRVVPPHFSLEILTKLDQKQTNAAVKLLTNKVWWEKQLRSRG